MPLAPLVASFVLLAAQDSLPVLGSDSVTRVEIAASDSHIEGRGRARQFTYVPDFRGTLLVWASSDEVDPMLRLASSSGAVLKEDLDSGGWTTAMLQGQCVGPTPIRIVVACEGETELGSIELHVVTLPESDATRSARARTTEALKASRTLFRDKQAASARKLLESAWAELRGTEGAATSSQVEAAAWDLGFAACDCGAIDLALESWEFTLARRVACLPPDHDAVLWARSNCAGLLNELDRVGTAIERLREVVAARSWAATPLHPGLLAARTNLANSLRRMGDLTGAIAQYSAVVESYERAGQSDDRGHLQALRGLAIALKDRGEATRAAALLRDVIEIQERTLPPDNPDVIHTRADLADCLAEAGDFDAAMRMQRDVLEALEQVYPPGNPTILNARTNLALYLKEMGQLDAAIELEEALAAEYARSRPAEDRDRLALLGNLAGSLRKTDRFDRALEIETSVLEVCRRRFPEEHPLRLSAAGNLAATKVRLGDLPGAIELAEHVFRIRSRILPPDSPALLTSQHDLAAILFESGQLERARALAEAVLEGRERSLPAGHVWISLARYNYAAHLAVSGDLEGALALTESALRDLEAVLPPSHPMLRDARRSVADRLTALGRIEEAHAVYVSLLARYTETLPQTHPEVLETRLRWARIQRKLGALAEARGTLEEVVTLEETLHPDHLKQLASAREQLASTLVLEGEPERAASLYAAVLEGRRAYLRDSDEAVLGARYNLAVTLYGLGRIEEACAVAAAMADGMIERIERVTRVSDREARSVVLAERNRQELIELLGRTVPGERWATLSFEISETLRVAAIATAVHSRPRADVGLLARRATVAAELVREASRPVQPGESAESRGDAITRLALERDRIERSICEGAGESGGSASQIRVAGLLRSLPAGSAAVSFRVHTPLRMDPSVSRLRHAAEQATAHVLRSDGKLVTVDLGPAQAVQTAVETWRKALGTSGDRGVGVSTKSGGDAGAAGDALRVLVLDPVLAAAGPGTHRLVVCLDGVLHLVPLDALPFGTGVLGERYRVELRTSFASVPAKALMTAAETSLLLIGDVDFDGTGGSPPNRSRSDPGRESGAGTFARLPQTLLEITQVSGAFLEAFGRAPIEFTGAGASPEALRGSCVGRRFVHIATHGWFAPHAVPEIPDREIELREWSALDPGATVNGLAPLALCGIALAGANCGRRTDGTPIGILTAEELRTFDLAQCELAVLSACESNVGIRTAGLGIQSLQTALHAAGARTAITSLWRVDDAATRKLFASFYRRLWRDGLSKAEALWQAKMVLRAEGHPLRDWAGWVLTGDPG